MMIKFNVGGKLNSFLYCMKTETKIEMCWKPFIDAIPFQANICIFLVVSHLVLDSRKYSAIEQFIHTYYVRPAELI